MLLDNTGISEAITLLTTYYNCIIKEGRTIKGLIEIKRGDNITIIKRVVTSATRSLSYWDRLAVGIYKIGIIRRYLAILRNTKDK